jgi:hypothetical protein
MKDKKCRFKGEGKKEQSGLTLYISFRAVHPVEAPNSYPRVRL